MPKALQMQSSKFRYAWFFFYQSYSLVCEERFDMNIEKVALKTLFRLFDWYLYYVFGRAPSIDS